jgi:hypothetical protein
MGVEMIAEAWEYELSSWIKVEDFIMPVREYVFDTGCYRCTAASASHYSLLAHTRKYVFYKEPSNR